MTAKKKGKMKLVTKAVQRAEKDARRAKIKIARVAALEDGKHVVELHVEDAPPLPADLSLYDTAPVALEELPPEHRTWWDKLWD